MPDSRRQEVATDLGLFALTVIWGVNFSVVKAVLVELEPLALNALRFPMAALVLIAFTRRGARLRVRRRDLPRLIALGVLGNVVYQLFFIFGIEATLAGNASLLLATTPVWTLILSTWKGHERPSGLMVLGVCGTLVGMVLVVLGRGDTVGLSVGSLGGDLLMVGAAVLWSIYTVGARGPILRYGSLPVTAWTLWIGTPLLVALGTPSLVRMDLGAVSAWAWAGVAYAGVFSVGIAYLLWYRGVQRLGNARTAAYSNLVPVTALLTAWVWLGEVPTLPQLAGAVVILGGVTLARWAGARQPPGPNSSRWSTSGNS